MRLKPATVRVCVAAPVERGRDTLFGLVALLALVGLFVMEALHGPMRADQPFGLTAPPAALGASSVPLVNGRGPAAPIDDRNKIVLTGIGSRR